MAEFSDADSSAIINSSALRECIAKPPAFRAGSVSCFLDFAAGGDENVVAVRFGNKVWIEKAWHDSNTMRACHEFKRVIEDLRRHGHVNIYGDGSQTDPTYWWAALGGFGVWMPDWNNEELIDQDKKGNFHVWTSDRADRVIFSPGTNCLACGPSHAYQVHVRIRQQNNC